MSLSSLIGSEWATMGNDESDCQPYTVSLAGESEIDASNKQESHRQAQGVTSHDEPILPPTPDERFEYEGGRCKHPHGDRHCHLHYPLATNAEGNVRHDVDNSMYLDHDSYLFGHSRHNPASDIEYNLQEERRTVSMPPAVERYVQDYQSHEVLAARLSTHDPHVDEVKAGKPQCERKSSRASSKGDSRGDQNDKGAGCRYASNDYNHYTTG